MSLTVAIMQPYFVPYAGYFRLFAAADLFVVLDCVQFPRRGWVHRNQLLDRDGKPQWLTLPYAKGDRDTTRICDLQFQQDAQEQLSKQVRRFPAMDEVEAAYPELAHEVLRLDCDPVGHLMATLQRVTGLLGISRPMIRSSTLDVPAAYKAQARIIEIAQRVGATHYVNAPGGREIYEPEGFRNAGLTLGFLTDYSGSFQSVLQRLSQESPSDIAKEIQSNTLVDRITCA